MKVRKKKGTFSSKGPNWVHSPDGLVKLMGYQNSTFQALSIQQKFRFQISEISRAQLKGTFRSQKHITKDSSGFHNDSTLITVIY